MKTIKRDDIQYLDIEKFEDYEFSSCTAYEMAIRNDEVIELIKRNNAYQLENIHNDSEITDKLLTEYYISDCYLAYHFFSDIIDIEKERNLSGWRWKEHKNSNEFEKTEEQTLTAEFFQGFTVRHNIIDSVVPEQSCILTSFMRPPLEPYPIIKELDVRLNFSLPEKDLVEYIKHIKRKFDKKNSFIKSAFEILNEIEFKNGDKINPRDILAYKERVADMFFIYDSIKLSHKILKIRYVLEDYYSNKGISTKSFTEKTIRKYYELAKEYIDNKKYKEIITGININEIEKIKEGNFNN